MTDKYIYVDIPYNEKKSYSLYARGMTIDKPVLALDESIITFKYPARTVFFLFYEFFTAGEFKTRRAYIVSGDLTAPGTAVSLPGISQKVKIIYCARGKKVDLIERALNLITKEDEYAAFRFSKEFFFQLAAIIKFWEAKRFDIIRLYNRYKPEEVRKLTYDNN